MLLSRLFLMQLPDALQRLPIQAIWIDDKPRESLKPGMTGHVANVGLIDL